MLEFILSFDILYSFSCRALAVFVYFLKTHLSGAVFPDWLDVFRSVSSPML